MSNLTLTVGDEIAVVYQPRNYACYRQYNNKIVKLSSNIVELEDGRRFSRLTLKEIKSDHCQDPKLSSLKLGSKEEYDVKEAAEQKRRELGVLWKNLEEAVSKKNQEQCQQILNSISDFQQ